MSQMKHLNHLKIPLQVIENCTEDFNERNYLGKGGYGRVYKGILSWADHENLPVAVKRLDVTGFQGNREFYTEVLMLSQYRHENIITLIGLCDDSNEMILVYEYASHGSLDTYLSDDAMLSELSWSKRLNICIGVASALDYLHNHVAAKHRIIHRDIKSANILLDENWNVKLSDFGLSRIGLSNQQNTFLITDVAGTHGYCDPQYERTGILTKESDVYSFVVVLFEVLCGRLACVTDYHDERRFLHHLARTCYKNGELDKIIDHNIREHIPPGTLSKFSAIAYQCLQETREERPTIAEVALKLQKATEIPGSPVGPSRGHMKRVCKTLRSMEDTFVGSSRRVTKHVLKKVLPEIEHVVQNTFSRQRMKHVLKKNVLGNVSMAKGDHSISMKERTFDMPDGVIRKETTE